MKIAVMVQAGPYQHQAWDSAVRFIRAALARGHDVIGVSVMTDAVHGLSRHSVAPAERPLGHWLAELAEEGVELIPCAHSAKLRGVLNEHVIEATTPRGITALAALIEDCDRFVTFGG